MPLPKIPFVYDQRLNNGKGGYRDTATGRAVAKGVFNGWRDETIKYQQGAAKELTNSLMTGKIDLNRWEREMRQVIKDTHGMLYAAGKGGYQNMTQADWGRVGADVKKQYEYLARLRQEIAAGKLSPAQAAARAAMYPSSANQSWEQGKTANVFNPRNLPAYPGDGTTVCKSNCRCYWDIREGENTWLAYWKLGMAEHCVDCVERSSKWAPYIVLKAPLGAV